MNDHRQHPRYAIGLDAEIDYGGQTILGRTLDVSRGGFCLLGRAPVALGTHCEARLALVFSEDQFSEQLRLPATIVWCTPTKGVYQIGFKFGSLTPDHKKFLILFLQLLEGGEHDGEHDDDDGDGEP
jgi:hypothetical protein